MARALDAQQASDGRTSGDGPREQRRRRRIETGQEQILDVAEQLFGAQGYRETSLQQVADRCEYSVGGLYLFFPNKAALFHAVMERRGHAQMELMRACAASEGPAAEVLVRLVRAIIEFFRRYPDFGRVQVRASSPALDPNPFAEGFDVGFAAAMEIYASVFVRGQAEGTLRRGVPGELARLLSALVTAHHTMDPHLTGGVLEMSDADFLDFVATAFRAVNPAQ